MVSRSDRLEHYRGWHHLQVATGDIDPAYPVLASICGQFGRTDGAWLVLRHVAYYHLGSALRSCADSPGPLLPARLLTLPTGVERRAHRDVRQFSAHWDDLTRQVAAYGGPAEFLTPTQAGFSGWDELTDRIRGVRGNGRWAAYKTAELVQKVLGSPICAPDAGHAHSTGPRRGLAVLGAVPEGNSPEAVAELDRLTDRLAFRLGERDIARVETSLCDFHSAYRGRYYIGKDIDEQLHQLTSVPSDFTDLAMSARGRAFPGAYLGELRGWTGPDKNRQTAYRDSGRILLRGEG